MIPWILVGYQITVTQIDYKKDCPGNVLTDCVSMGQS